MYRALIVEDEDLMREYLEKKLSAICAEWEAADTAVDGQEAIEKMEKAHFDGIITDIRMPVMDGLAMSKAIREKDPQIPILIISGYNEFDYARKAVRLNIFDYLLKPIDEQELAAALSAMAIQAGQKRKPAQTAESIENVSENTEGLAQRALTYIQQHFSDPISLTSVAEEMGVSPAYLSTVFHREIGTSYSRTLLKIRMEEAARQLIQTGRKVQQIAQNVGFFSAKHFTHVFHAYYHSSPVEFRLHPPAGKETILRLQRDKPDNHPDA